MREALRLVWDYEIGQFRLYGEEGEKQLPENIPTGRQCKVAEAIGLMLGYLALPTIYEGEFVLIERGCALQLGFGENGQLRAGLRRC